MSTIRQLLCLLVFAVWFGGFTFYISVVVPTGTGVLGSAKTQGFVTQQVTHHLNWMSCVACAFMIWEVLAGFPVRERKSKIAATAIVALIFLISILLIYVHGVLDGFLDFENRAVRQKAVFYQWHRVYLWGSTFQWALGIAYAVLLVRSWRPIDLPDSILE